MPLVAFKYIRRRNLGPKAGPKCLCTLALYRNSAKYENKMSTKSVIQGVYIKLWISLVR